MEMKVHDYSKNFGMIIPKRLIYPTKSFSLNLICFVYSNGWIWFRIFGFGLYIKNTKKVEPLFSERNDIVKPFKIGRYAIKGLTPPMPSIFKKKQPAYSFKSWEYKPFDTGNDKSIWQQKYDEK